MILNRSFGHVQQLGNLAGGLVFKPAQPENPAGFFRKLVHGVFKNTGNLQKIKGVFRAGFLHHTGVMFQVFVGVKFLAVVVDNLVFQSREKVTADVVDLLQAAFFPQTHKHILHEFFCLAFRPHFKPGSIIQGLPVSFIDFPEGLIVIHAEKSDQ